MKRLNAYLLLCCVSFLLISCGTEEKTNEEKAKDKINEGVDKITEGLGDVSKEIEGGLAGALSQLGDAVDGLQNDGEGKKKKPLNFRKLKELLPESFDGYSRDQFGGESTGMAGFNVSTASAEYKDGDKRIDVDIVDAGGLGSAMMGLAAWSIVDVDKESNDGFERTTTYKGNKAFEKCNKNRCEFSIFVANRFILTAKGRGGDMSIDELHEIVDEIGLSKLENMKDDEG